MNLMASLTDISIHAAREGGDEAYKAAIDELAISIHAARDGGDRRKRNPCKGRHDFNPRRP